MDDAIQFNCNKCKDKFECPDTLLAYNPKFDEYRIIIHDGGAAVASIFD